MKRILLVALMLLLVGCDLPDGMIITPTSVGVTVVPSQTPIIITATPEPTLTPTATATITLTPTVDWSATPTAIVPFICEWETIIIVCKADPCIVRIRPEAGDEAVGLTVPVGTELFSFGVCNIGNGSIDWYYVGVDGDSERLYVVKLNSIWEEK